MRKSLDPDVLTKSGIMLGLGEPMDEVKAVMQDLRNWGVDILTIGQYLQPSRHHLPIERYYTLEEFDMTQTIRAGDRVQMGRKCPTGAFLIPRSRTGARIKSQFHLPDYNLTVL